MDNPNTRSRISRVDIRFRQRPGNLRSDRDTAILPLDFKHDDDTMTKDHRSFHRRAAQAGTRVVTVEVVAHVDASGNVVAKETVLPAPSLVNAAVPPTLAAVPAAAAALPSAAQEVLPSVPVVAAAAAAVSVPAVPTQIIPSLPSVPAVPPFPSDLVVPSVPAFPFPSGVPVAVAAVSSVDVSSTPVPAITSAPVSSINPQSNFTMSSTHSSNSRSAMTMDSISASLSASTLLSSRASSFSSMSEPISVRVMTNSGAATTTVAGVGGFPGSPAGPAQTTAAAGGAKANSTPPLETPQVVGSVVGSLAGAALILAIILLLLQRHKRRRGGALQLTGDDHTDHDQQPMTQSGGRGLIPSTFLNRFSGMSRSTADTTFTGGEKSFQRVSGRKLPSAFSEGMTSEQFSRGGGTLSGSSFYTDDHGTYGGAGYSKEFGKEIGDSPYNRESGPMSFRPSPARTPIIRNPDDPSFWGRGRSNLSPPQSPNSDIPPPPRGTLGRSLPSADGSRSSRFTENV